MMEEPAVRNCLLDMLSVTDTAVNSIRKNPSPQSNNSNPDVSASQSSSVSQESCKESVGGSTTVSEVLIASTNVARCELEDKPLPKQVTVVRHNDMTTKSDVDVIKSQNTLLRMLSESSYDDEAKENLPMGENVNDSIISVEGRITNPHDRKADSRKDRFFQVDRNHNEKKNQGVESESCSSARTTTGSSIQDDVKIEQFHLTDKQKSLRQLLGKKSDQSGPVKRVIHPKLLQKQEPVQKMCKKDEGCVSKEMLAASVAATAAAAVAQPFFQFQKEFEEKIHQTYHLVKNNPQSTEDSDKRIEELEKKVSVLNEQRIDHLEKLQQYQMEIQTQMLSQPCKQTIANYHSAKPGVISDAPNIERPSQASTVYFPRQAPQPTHYSYPSERPVESSYPREPPSVAYFPRDYPHASRAREPMYPAEFQRDHPHTSRSRDPLYAADFQRDHPQSRNRERSPNVIYPREDKRQVHIPRDPTSRAHFQRSPPAQDGTAKSFPVKDRSFSPKNEPAFKVSPKKASQLKMSPPRAQLSKTQQSKRKSPPRQEVKYFPRKREQPKRSRVKNKERKDSPLDTPAPRTRVPTPMVYDDDASHSSDPRFVHKGLLEEIMEKDSSPLKHDKDTTFSVPDDTLYNRYDYDDKEKPVDQASRLLDKMVDLKHQVGRVANGRFDDQFNYGPYPLDPYLKTGRGSDVKAQPLQVNAPVYNNYSDVKKVLNTVNKKISQLESNLKHVTRFQNEAELSCLAKVLQGESEDLEKNKIKSMVDRLIKSKRKIIEDDVQRELLNAELKKQELIEASKKPSTKDISKKGAAGGRVSQTYQRKRETTKFTQERERPAISRPYGKNLLPSSSVRVGRSEPITSKVDSKTVYKTLITQTKQQQRQHHKPQHQQPAYTQQQTAPVINNIMPMAVALCEPRYLPGRAAGVLSCEPMACSSPSSQTHPTSLPNLSNIQDTTFIDQINSPTLSPRSPGHQSPTHSMVDNYSDVEGTGIILPGYQHEVYKQPPDPSRVVFKPPNLESYDQNPTSDVIANDIHRQNLLQEKASQWLESELMAQVLSQVNRGGDEKIHHEYSWGTDHQYNYRNLVNKQTGVNQDSQISDDSATQSESVEEDLQEKIQKIFISVGQPVNNNIISTLVQEALTDRIRTLLGESQPSTSGTQPVKTTTDVDEVKDNYDDDFESGDSPEPSMKQLPTPDLTPMSSRSVSPARRESPPPRKHSPVRSPQPRIPRRQKVEEIDDSDVYNSMMMTKQPDPIIPPQQPAIVPSPDSDSDPSTSYDISQELRRLAVKPEEKADFIIQSVHDVETPVPTPPPRSPTPVQILPQFIASPPPPVSVHQPLTVHRSITEEPSYHDISRSRPDPDATGTSFNFNRTGMSVDNIVQDVRKSTTIVRMSSNSVRDSIEVPQPQVSPRPVPQPTVIHVGSPRAISPVRDPSLIPSPDQPSSPSTSITDTINECISEGQWLLNRSEGQVAEIPIDPAVIENVKYNRVDISTASTLRDTEDLDLDDLDNLKSEGEFIHYSSVPVQHDINSLLQRQQESYRRDHVDGPGYPTHNPELNVTESMGELSLGQIQSSRVGVPQPFQTNRDTHASDDISEEDSGLSNVIRVGESLPGTSQRNFSHPPVSQTGPQFSTYTRQSKDENGTSRDSTMNLEDLDISKRKIPPLRTWTDKPKTTTFSLSVDSMRSSGGLEMTESELDSDRYGVRESQDSDRYRLGDTLDSDRYRLGESADSDRYKYHDLLDSDRYKFRQSMDSEMSAQTNEDEPEEQDRRDSKGQSGPYRMSVTVPSVHPISEDEDSEEISEIDATVSK